MVDRPENVSDRTVIPNNNNNYQASALPHTLLSQTTSACMSPMMKRAAFASRTSSHSSILSNQLSAHELEGYYSSRPGTPSSHYLGDSSVIKS